MPSNNSKYTPEMREQTVRFILDSKKSASSVAEEMGIDKNTVCSWVRTFRRKNNMPSYAEAKGIKAKDQVSDRELIQRNRELDPRWVLFSDMQFHMHRKMSTLSGKPIQR